MMGRASHQLPLSGEFEPDAILGRRLRRWRGRGGTFPQDLPFSVQVIGTVRGLSIAILEAPIGGGVPAYAERRTWRGMVNAPVGDGILIFTDAPHSVFVWSWPDECGPELSRYAECVVPGDEGRLASTWWRPARAAKEAGYTTLPAAAREEKLLIALGRVLRPAIRDRADAWSWQTYLEEISTVGDLRRLWKRLLRTRILDPSGDLSGARLIETARTLQWIYLVLLERMGAFVTDSRLANDRRPEFIRDLKLVVNAAREVDRGARTERRRASFASLLIFQHNLYAVAESDLGARKLLGALRKEFPRLDPGLRILDVNVIGRNEFEAWREIASIKAAEPTTSEVGVQSLIEEIDALGFAWRRVREMRWMGSSTTTELRNAAAGIGRRRASLIRRVTGVCRSNRLTAALKPRASSLYFAGISRYQDFDITLPAE